MATKGVVLVPEGQPEGFDPPSVDGRDCPEAHRRSAEGDDGHRVATVGREDAADLGAPPAVEVLNAEGLGLMTIDATEGCLNRQGRRQVR